MILFLILLVIAAVIIGLRGQSANQHREMMEVLAPEKLAAQDKKQRDHNAVIFAIGAIPIALIVFGIICHLITGN